MTTVNITTNKNTVTVDENNSSVIEVATQGPQGASGSAAIADDSIVEAKLDIHADPSGTNKFLGYTANGMEWAVPPDTQYSVGDNGLTKNNFTDALKTKLDGIEASATGDQTNAEIRTAVEAASDSNVFTDADHTKLNGIEASATADQTGAEIKSAYEGESNTNAFTDAEKTKLSGIATSANNYSISSDLLDEDDMATNSATKVPSQQSVKAYVDSNSGTTYTAGTGLNLSGTEFSVTSIALTSVQEAANESAQLSLTTQEGDVVVRTDENKTYVKNAGTSNSMSDFTLLRTPTDAVLSVNGNTGAITAAQIASAVEAASDSNTFTDADHTKLNAIESSATADQTGAEIKTAYEAEADTNAFTDSEKTKLSGIATGATNTAAPYYTSAISVGDGGLTQNNFTNADHTKLDGIEASADVTDATNVDSAGAVMNSDLDGKGELLVGDGSGDPTALAAGTDGYVLKADSNEATGLKWSAAGSGGDANQNAFSNFAVSGQTTVAADSTTDTVTLVGGTNVTITTNATNDEITFTSTDTTYSVQDGQLSQNSFTDADHTKLDGIETSATADQTGAEIKTAYEAESDTNAYTDAEKTKLAGIEASATADQTDAEIRTAVEAATDSNVFTDADHTKLDGIETSADVTDATNVDAAGAVMNSDLDGKGELLVGDGSGDPTALAVGTNNYVLTADSGEATGVKWAAAATGTPEGTAILSTGESGGTKFLREDGDGTCSWQTVSGGGGGGTPGGANTQVQYNSSGSFAGSSNLTFDGTNLAVGGTVTATSTALATGGVRKIFTSSSAPQASDGAVGDIWLKF